MMVDDLAAVEKQLGFRYELGSGDDRASHYQHVCPRCRRAMFGLAQGRLWQHALADRLSEHGDHSR
jgi:hypothetical protein